MVRTTRKHRGRKSLRSSRKPVQRGGTGVARIPKLVHQIWFGGPVPASKQRMFDLNAEIARRNGYHYKLWLEADRIEPKTITKKNGAKKESRTYFPMTWEYQNTAIKAGEDAEQNRMAQVADLARLEIIYQFGGVYLDSIFESSDELLEAIDELSEKGFTFIGANEDPCKLDCVGWNKTPYLSNSFFAAIEGHDILGRLLSEEKLDAIDFESEYINRTTGPYYLRSGIEDEEEDKVFLFETDQIFPFNQQETPYQPKRPNTCLGIEAGEGRVQVMDAKGGRPAVYMKTNCLEARQKEFIEKEVAKLTAQQASANAGTHKELQKLIDSANTNATEFIIKQKGPLAIYHSGLGGTWSL